MMGRRKRIFSALLVGSAALWAFAGPAYASLGIGVQSQPVVLASAAKPGGTYQFLPVFVVDNGTEPESVAVHVERLSKGTGITIPPQWVTLIGPSPHLQPKQSTYLHLRLTVPSNASRGQYFSDLVVTAVVPKVTGQPNFGAAAATKLQFTVGSPAGHSSGLHVSPWVWGIGGGVILLGLGIVALRHSGLRITIDRT